MKVKPDAVVVSRAGATGEGRGTKGTKVLLAAGQDQCVSLRDLEIAIARLGTWERK